MVKATCSSGATAASSETVTVNNTSTSTGTLSSGLVGYWKLDEGTGLTTADSSGSGATGTIKSATWAAGRLNQALKFSGASSVSLSSAAALKASTFTWSAWVYVSGEPLNGMGPIVELGYGSDVGRTLSFNRISTSWQPSTVFGFVNASKTDAESISANNSFAVGVWQHWLITYNDAGDRMVHIYRNGAEVTYQKQVAAKGTLTSKGTYTGALGATPATGFFGFNGLLDDVRVYNRVLSASEIQSLASGATQ